MVLAPAEARLGFALAGVRQREVAADQVWTVLHETMADMEVGVIAADERLLAGLDPLRLRELTTRWGGILVTLPAPAVAGPLVEDELQRLIRRALGYHVKL